MIVNNYKIGKREKLWKLLLGGYGVSKLKEREYIRGINKYLRSYDFDNPLPPSRIEIETLNKCNGECSFCPANRHNDKRPTIKMEEDVFHKIINDLETWNFSGRLGLHSNNEPLLDVRIVDFAEYARKHIPQAKIYMYTNGTLITVEKLEALMRHLSYIIIDNYNDKLELNSNIREIYEFTEKDHDLRERVEIHLRKQNEVLSTRGGLSPNNDKTEEILYSCYMPFVQMVFRPDGKVSQCCCDVFGKKTMGDVNVLSVKEIWEQEKYKNLRRTIAKGRKYIDICKTCDMKTNAI